MTVASSTFTLTILPSVSPYEELFNAIRTKFKNDVADTVEGGLSVHYDNAPYDKPNNAKWVRLTIAPDESHQITFGGVQNRFRIPGLMTCEIYAPIEQGNFEALQLTDFIANIFRSISVTTLGGDVARFKTPSVAPVGRIGNQWRLDVKCPFLFDHFVDS